MDREAMKESISQMGGTQFFHAHHSISFSETNTFCKTDVDTI